MTIKSSTWITLALVIALVLSLSLNVLGWYAFKQWNSYSQFTEIQNANFRATKYRKLRDEIGAGEMETAERMLALLHSLEVEHLRGMLDGKYYPKPITKHASVVLTRVEEEWEQTGSSSE